MWGGTAVRGAGADVRADRRCQCPEEAPVHQHSSTRPPPAATLALLEASGQAFVLGYTGPQGGGGWEPTAPSMRGGGHGISEASSRCTAASPRQSPPGELSRLAGPAQCPGLGLRAGLLSLGGSTRLEGSES